MEAARPTLALIGHGTDGSDGLERGVHLRWAFRREMGFPPGGFSLYRRATRAPKFQCFSFGRIPLGDHAGVTLGEKRTPITIESAKPIRALEISVARGDALL